MPEKQHKTVDEMIMGLPKKEQVIVKRLRALVQECIPKASEHISYEVPYYRHHRLICFIWPPSVFWGPGRTIETQEAKGTSLGFCQGNLMSNDDGALLAEGRKQIYVMYFKTLADINEQQIRTHLFEAAMLDDEFGERKKRAKLSKRKK